MHLVILYDVSTCKISKFIVVFFYLLKTIAKYFIRLTCFVVIDASNPQTSFNF